MELPANTRYYELIFPNNQQYDQSFCCHPLPCPNHPVDPADPNLKYYLSGICLHRKYEQYKSIDIPLKWWDVPKKENKKRVGECSHGIFEIKMGEFSGCPINNCGMPINVREIEESELKRIIEHKKNIFLMGPPAYRNVQTCVPQQTHNTKCPASVPPAYRNRCQN